MPYYEQYSSFDVRAKELCPRPHTPQRIQCNTMPCYMSIAFCTFRGTITNFLPFAQKFVV